MPDSQPDSDAISDAGQTTRWRTTSRFYRRPLGLVWLIALALIPLLLAVIGYSLLDRSDSPAGGELEPSLAWPTLVEPTLSHVPPAPPPGMALAPLSIVRTGNEITVQGEMPDQSAKRALLDSVIDSIGDDSNVIDTVVVNPNIKALDFSAAGPVFEAAAAVPDFSLTVNGDTVTLVGTAATGDDEGAVLDAAGEAWPNVNIVNMLEISGPVTPTPSG